MTIDNLHSALELWDNGFNLFPIKSIPNLSFRDLGSPDDFLNKII